MKFTHSKILILVAAAALLTAPQVARSADYADLAASIEAAMGGDHRSTDNRARNRYRHPVGALMFLGLESDMKVMEIWPGGGWYTEILAPVVREQGLLVVAGYDVEIEGQPQYRYGLQDALLNKFSAHPDIYDRVEVQPFSPPKSASLGPAASLDMVLTFRNVHGWIGSDEAELVFTEFARVLKPGGVLGVVQHRAAAGSDPAQSSQSGYVSEEAVVALANRAGLDLEARSEVNANRRDSKDYQSGVWSLPPGLAMCREAEGEAAFGTCAEPYLAIGESDRMTLKFRKPMR